MQSSNQANQSKQLSRPLRVIVIDDNIDWCKALSRMIIGLHHIADVAYNVEDAYQKIRDAWQQSQGYAIAIIDMNFKEGDTDIQAGIELIDHIKAEHPYIACIVISAERTSPDYILDLRDEHLVDYYLPKEHISSSKLKKAIERSLQRLGSLWEKNLNIQDIASHTSDSATHSAPNSESQVAFSQDSSSSTKLIRPESVHVQLDFRVAQHDAHVTWRALLIGREDTRFSMPYSVSELILVIRALNVLQYPAYPVASNESEGRIFNFDDEEKRILTQLRLWQNERVVANAHEVIGQAIYRAFGTDGQNLMRSMRNSGIAYAGITNYVLRFPREAIDIAALPFELTWDQERNQPILIRGNTIDTCERYIDIDMALPPPLSRGQKPYILALSPRYGIPEELRQRERQARIKVWDRLQQEGKISYDEISPLTMADLNNHLDQLPQRPDIIHYFGHGTFFKDEGYLYFDDTNGGRDLVSAKRLAAALGDVRLIVLHACQSAVISDTGGLLTGIAPALSVVSGAVVAMQLTVRTESALRFMEVFYNYLLSRAYSLQEAVARGRQVLFTETTDGASWYVPVLYIRSREQAPMYLIQQ